MFGRTIVCSIAALALVCTWAQAADVSDPENTFRVTVPDDWSIERPQIPNVKAILVSPRTSETGGNCNIVVVADEATKGMSQSEVEATLTQEVNEAWWREAILGAKNVKSTNIEKWGAKQHRGRKTFFVRATSVFERKDGLVSLTQVLDLHAIPGRNYGVTCTARAERFAEEQHGFAVIMASFEVITDMTVSAGQKGGAAPLATTHQLLMKSAVDGLSTSSTRALR